MEISMQWQLKGQILIRVGKKAWQQVAMYQPALWRVDKPSYDLSFLKPDAYELLIADSRYDTALLSEALANIIIYLNDQGIETADLVLRVVSERPVLADELRQLLGSWVYGRVSIATTPTDKKKLLVSQVGVNPSIEFDQAVYVVPSGNGGIYAFTDDKSLSWQQYDRQCGADIPLADLVIAYDSAMLTAFPFGSEERTKRQVKKLKQLLKPEGKAILLAGKAMFGNYENVFVVDKDSFHETLQEIEKDREKNWGQVVLFYDLAYTKIRNVIF